MKYPNKKLHKIKFSNNSMNLLVQNSGKVFGQNSGNNASLRKSASEK